MTITPERRAQREKLLEMLQEAGINYVVLLLTHNV
jgi:hypothetical protein